MRNVIIKSDWLTALLCPKQAWLGLRTDPPAPSESEQFRMEQGNEVGAHARELFPQGKLVFGLPGKSAAQVTSELIAAGEDALFEAAFVSGPFVARADILTRVPGGFHVLEVKSSFALNSKNKDNTKDLIDDLAYTAMVARRSGIEVTKASLVLLSRDYRGGDRVEKLFEVVEKTEEVAPKVKEFAGEADRIAEVLFGEAVPGPVLVSSCRKCSYFETSCLGVDIEHSVLELPNLHHTKLKRLSAARVVRMSDVPDDLELNGTQLRAKNSALSGKRIFEAGLGPALQSFVWPCYYLDFETVATVLPIYPGRKCHEQVLTQFSIHRRDSLAGEVRHAEYLAAAERDCARELAEKLIAALGSEGSILVYSDFEEKRIRELGERFPDLNPAIQAILGRLVDLLPIISDHVYDPAFRGSFSIKDVLPVLVPDLSYDGLAIADGDMAIAMFARMAKGEITGEGVESTRRALLEYCKVDTLAMVRLHEVLVGMSPA